MAALTFSVWNLSAAGRAEDPVPRDVPQQTPNEAERIIPTDDPELMRQIDEINRVVIPQRKPMIEALIKKYPDTNVARLGAELLKDYDRYEADAAAQRARDAAWAGQIRAYWDARRPYPQSLTNVPYVEIANDSEGLLVCQVRGFDTKWMGPYVIRRGSSLKFYDPVEFRRLTESGKEQVLLPLGTRYVYRGPTASAEPRSTGR